MGIQSCPDYCEALQGNRTSEAPRLWKPEGTAEGNGTHRARREAQAKARDILEKVEADGGRRVSNDEVLSTLQLWGFKENANRTNVMQEGVKFIYSDTIGLVKTTVGEKTLLTQGTKCYPEVTQLLTRWFKERLPDTDLEEFAYTSININKNYAGKLHRDTNNVGPSFIKAFGDFAGGELNYYPSDDKCTPVEDLDPEEKVTIDIKDNLLLFDGTRGHSVNCFTGERYSLVFFSVRTWNKAGKEDREEAIRCGIPMPSKASMAHAQGLLGPSGQEGYRAYPENDERTTSGSVAARREPLELRDLELTAL